MTRIRRRRKSWKNGHEFVTSKKRQRLNLPDARHPRPTRDEDTEPFCSRYANFDIVRPRKKKTKRKENRRKKRRWFGRVLRDRERSIFMLIGAISRISNFSPVKYHRSKVFHEGGNKSHFMEIARPPNNAQLRPPTYSSLFFFSASISTGEWVSVEGEEENYGWKVFMSVDDGNVVASLLCREGDKGKNFFEMILFFRWWLFVKKIGERGRGGYEDLVFFGNKWILEVGST